MAAPCGPGQVEELRAYSSYRAGAEIQASANGSGHGWLCPAEQRGYLSMTILNIAIASSPKPTGANTIRTSTRSRMVTGRSRLNLR